MAILDKMVKAWNAFRESEKKELSREYSVGPPVYSTVRPDRPRYNSINTQSIVASIYTRIAVDAAGLPIKHVQLDENKRYLEEVESWLNNALTLEPNIDQGPRHFRQDVVMTMFDHGTAAIVPVDTSRNPETNEVFDIYTLRVGYVVAWYPKHVKVSLWNVDKGLREEVLIEKEICAIIENPLYSVMNESNSVAQRLINKLNLLDVIDEASGSGKLDLIIQVPYQIKSEAREKQAEKRKQAIEDQLKDSTYGIAYTDGTEKITQLNRPAENNLMKQIEFLTVMLYGQLGVTEEVMNGTADEKAILNYINRTIEPILDAIVESMQRTFLGYMKTKSGERIQYFQTPFKLTPLSELADIIDRLSRNEIVTGNEIRGAIGFEPSSDPKADELNNSNMPNDRVTLEDGVTSEGTS